MQNSSDFWWKKEEMIRNTAYSYQYYGTIRQDASSFFACHGNVQARKTNLNATNAKHYSSRVICVYAYVQIRVVKLWAGMHDQPGMAIPRGGVTSLHVQSGNVLHKAINMAMLFKVRSLLATLLAIFVAL
jgi:hypothetical protein